MTSTPWRGFASDNYAGIHPEILEAIARVNAGHQVAYGDDDVTAAKLTATGNAFQARYAIRHPWTGPVACESPRRNVWGPPPGGSEAPVAAARELADAPREGVSLRAMVRTPVTDVDLDARLTLPTGTAGATPPQSSTGPEPPPPVLAVLPE